MKQEVVGECVTCGEIYRVESGMELMDINCVCGGPENAKKLGFEIIDILKVVSLEGRF